MDIYAHVLDETLREGVERLDVLLSDMRDTDDQGDT